MTKLIIISHPEIENSTVQSFLLEGLNQAKLDVDVVKLDRGYDIKELQQKILQANEIFFQFPLYWYHAPSSLGKFQEDVFTNKFVAKIRDANAAKLKKLSLIVSFSDKLADFQAGTKIGHSLSELLSPYQSFATSLGFLFEPTFVIPQFQYQTEDAQQLLLINYLQKISRSNQSFLKRGEWLLKMLETQQQDELLIDYLRQQLAEYETLDQTIKDLKDGQE